MSRQWICPRCQGEYHTAEDHACLPGETMRGPDVDENGARLLPNAAIPRRDQEDDEASRRT